jgi:hypothetical protein
MNYACFHLFHRIFALMHSTLKRAHQWHGAVKKLIIGFRKRLEQKIGDKMTKGGLDWRARISQLL